MHRVVPELIIENYREGCYNGDFQAVSLFLDLSGFSTMTDVLMQHGQHGAEVLAGLMHGVFDPLVESIFDYGGKIIGFAGDGIMALFPVESDARLTSLRALTSAYVIQNRFQENHTRQTVYGEFSIFAKIGLGYGPVSWGILRSRGGNQAAYYFRGSAVDEAAEAEHHASAGEILLTGNIYDLLREDVESRPRASLQCFTGFSIETPPPARVVFPSVDLSVARLFMPEDVIAHDVRGEFRQVVNLFMRFPDLSSEALQKLMSTVFELRNRYGGLVSRLDFGDKGCNMLMLWGAPVSYENDIGRALNFLLDLRSALDFPIAAGVTYYISHAGYLGSSLYEDYTCYGWGVNLASRFMMSAQPGQIWVDDRIARRVSRRFEIDFVSTQLFKGFSSPQKVYMLRGYTQTLEPAYQGELVGRAAELAQLASFTAPLWDDRFAGLLLLSGEAGIGKGRLVHEFRSSMRQKGKRVLWAVCQSNQILRQSFNPLRSWLFRYYGISSTQPVEEQKQSFDAKLDDLLASISDPEIAQELQRTRSILGALLNLHWENSLHEQLDPEGRYNNTFLALIALFKAESLRQPVILVYEDIQFTDKDSKDLLPRLKRAILAAGESYPIAIIATTRPGLGLPKELIDVRMDLGAISEDAMAHLAEISLGGAPAPGLVRLLVERSEGNPYFAEQILRYLQEESLIETSQVGWRLVREIEESFLPGDIRSLLVARLDQLARGVRESIQTASVLGREFEVPILERMWREDEPLHPHIAEAEQAAVWNPSDDLHYIFSHGLLRDAAYEMQMQARRRELHALALEALEHLYGDIPSRYAELAHHAKYAEHGSKAQEYYMLAGKVAAQAYHNQQAIDHYRRALAFTPLNDVHTQFEILNQRVELYNRLGDRPSQWKDLQTLESLAHQLNDPRLIGKVDMLVAHYYISVGDYPGVLQRAQHVVEMSRIVPDAETLLDTYHVWPLALLRQGEFEEAMRVAREGRGLAQWHADPVREGYVLNTMGLIAIEQKDPTIAHEYFEQALAIARAQGDRRLESGTLGNLGNSAGYIRKDYESAREYYEADYAISHERGDRSAEAAGLCNLGWAAGMQGDFEPARSYYERALLLAREVGHIYLETYTLINLSANAGLTNEAQVSLNYAEKALELSDKAGDRSGEAWSLLYEGYAFLLLSDLTKAEEAFQRAIRIRDELGQPGMKFEALAGLIQCFLRKGDDASALLETEKILSHLEEGGNLEGAEAPLRVHFACYLVLEKAGDPRSQTVLHSAVQLLEAQVSKLRSEESRRIYVENVPWRNAILQAWREKSNLAKGNDRPVDHHR
jgi:class 3 adenylate cyclase/tetratricopeptide (TPR) repeat protein